MTDVRLPWLRPVATAPEATAVPVAMQPLTMRTEVVDVALAASPDTTNAPFEPSQQTERRQAGQHTPADPSRAGRIAARTEVQVGDLGMADELEVRNRLDQLAIKTAELPVNPQQILAVQSAAHKDPPPLSGAGAADRTPFF